MHTERVAVLFTKHVSHTVFGRFREIFTTTHHSDAGERVCSRSQRVLELVFALALVVIIILICTACRGALVASVTNTDRPSFLGSFLGRPLSLLCLGPASPPSVRPWWGGEAAPSSHVFTIVGFYGSRTAGQYSCVTAAVSRFHARFGFCVWLSYTDVFTFSSAAFPCGPRPVSGP